MKCLILPLALLVSVVAPGCGSESSEKADSTCNTVVNDGPWVTSTPVQGAAPAPLGGTIVDGTYELVTLSDYWGDADLAGSQVMKGRILLEIEAENLQIVSDFGSETQRLGAQISTSGTVLSMHYTCPQVGSGGFAYTATSSELRLYTPSKIAGTDTTVMTEDVFALRTPH